MGEGILAEKDNLVFDIPNNWVWIKLDKLCNVETGKLNANAAVEEGEYPFFTCSKEIYRINEYAFDTEAVLVAGNGDFNVKYYKGKFNAYQRTYVLKNIIIDAKYLYYFIESMLDDITKNKRGSTIKYIRKGDLTDYKVCVPPLIEQSRIVNKIEGLLNKTQTARELIEQAEDSFKDRMFSILEKAFRGDLTKNWRKNNFNIKSADDLLNTIIKKREIVDTSPYELPEKWCWAKFEDVAEIETNLVDPLEYSEFPHIAPNNIEKFTGRLLNYETIAESGVKSGKHYFYSSRIIYSKIRPYLSKLIISEFEGLCSADMYPINPKINLFYLFNYMLSNTFLNFASTSGSRSVLPKINQKELKAIVVPVAPLEEQKEIVKILDSMLEKIKKEREIIKKAKDKLDTIEKSILAKAFRGELGTNNPEDEDALELLKTVMSNE